LFVSVSACSDTTKELFFSLLHIFKMNSKVMESVFEQFEFVDFDSWGSGYEFIDAVDIDADGNPELIFRVDGYESSGIEIYKYQKGKFSKVLETGLYGC
jgi:hypothetical protein